MAKELDAILDHGEANPAPSCIMENGSVSFLDKIICPVYETMAAVSISFLNNILYALYEILIYITFSCLQKLVLKSLFYQSKCACEIIFLWLISITNCI